MRWFVKEKIAKIFTGESLKFDVKSRAEFLVEKSFERADKAWKKSK